MKLELGTYLYKTIHLRYRRRPKTIFGLNNRMHIRKWMRLYFSSATTADHEALRDQAIENNLFYDDLWHDTAKKEFEKIFGRLLGEEPLYWGIGRNEFSQEMQNQLLIASCMADTFDRIAWVHDLMLPKHLRVTGPAEPIMWFDGFRPILRHLKNAVNIKPSSKVTNQ